VLHDSEDVIDPRSFEIYNAYVEDYDFIQIPVFSLDSRNRSLVGATYMDEFAERHTREMVVRDALGAAIPSAGVGTCVTKRLVRHFLRQRGHVLATGCVTEDYILGIEAKRAGFRAAFAAASESAARYGEFVATREFFPLQRFPLKLNRGE
jgi:adsorption protein B